MKKVMKKVKFLFSQKQNHLSLNIRIQIVSKKNLNTTAFIDFIRKNKHSELNKKFKCWNGEKLLVKSYVL